MLNVVLAAQQVQGKARGPTVLTSTNVAKVATIVLKMVAKHRWERAHSMMVEKPLINCCKTVKRKRRK